MTNTELISNAYISRVLAHTIVYESNPAGVALFCGGGSPAPNVSESMRSILSAYTEQMPKLMSVTADSALPTAQKLQEASAAISPQQAQLGYELLRDYGGKYAEAGAAADAASRKAQTQTDLDILRGSGGQLADAAVEAQRKADPEYYRTRALSADAMSKLMASLDDPNGGLSGAERAEVERSTARDNAARGLETPTATSTVENAMNFGQAGAERKSQKQQAISNAVNTASQAIPGMQSGIDVSQLAIGKPAMSTGINRLGGQANVGSESFNMGGQLLNSATSANNAALTANAARPNASQQFAQIAGGIGSMMPSCCWIFMEAYNGPVPPFVRYARDIYRTEDNYAGYKWLSRWLVPLMRINPWVRRLVNRYMVHPLTAHAGAIMGEPGYEFGRKYKRYHTVWFSIWTTIGKIIK